MNKIFSGGQVEGQAHAYTEIPLGLTCEEWKQCYKLIFGRNDLNGNFYWKLFSVNGSTKGVRPGMNDPTIQYSCYQWFKAEDVSPFYTMKSISDKVYLNFRDWFLQYHYPFVVSHFQATSLTEISSNPTFIKLLFTTSEHYKRNEKCAGENNQTSINYVLQKVDLFRQQSKCRGKLKKEIRVA